MLNSRVEREVKTVARRLQIELRRGKDLIRVERDWYRISNTALLLYCSTALLLWRWDSTCNAGLKGRH